MPSTPDSRNRAPDRPGWWQCTAVGADGAPLWFALVSSGRHPDGARVRLPAEAAVREVGGDAVCTADYDEHARVAALRLGPRGAPGAPPLWFVEVRETAGDPPAVSLVAFTGHGVAGGALVGESDIGGTGATSADQVGALRWYPATGEVDQIYVQPAWRRRGVGGLIVAAAAALSYARDWPRLWSDGQRTLLGERFVDAAPWRHRTAELTHLAPPMTPGEA